MSDEPEPPKPPNGPGFMLFIAGMLLVAVIAGELFIIVGHNMVCYFKGGCPFDEIQFGMEQLGALLATIIALIFALVKR